MAEDEDYGLMPIGEDGDEDDDGLDTFGDDTEAGTSLWILLRTHILF